MLSKVPSGRSHRSGRSGGGQESAIHGVAESDAADLSPKSQVQIIISEIEDFDDIAREAIPASPRKKRRHPCPTCYREDRHRSFPLHPSSSQRQIRPISIGTPGTRQKTRTGSGAPPLCHRFLWAKCWQRQALAQVWLCCSRVDMADDHYRGGFSRGFSGHDTPSYRLTRLQMDVDALMSLVTAASGAATESANQVPDQVFRAEVEMKNPNLVWGRDPARQTFTSFSRGREVGTGTTPACKPPTAVNSNCGCRRGACRLTRSCLMPSLVRWPREVPLLTFEVVAKSEFQSIFGVELNYTLHCKIDFSIPDLMMSDTRARAVTGRECKHAYF